MTAGLTEAQRAVYHALAGANVADGRISDNPRDVVDFPHVEIGETAASNDKLSGYRDGTDESMILTVWSRERSAKEIKSICDAIRTTLDGQRLDAMGRTSVSCYVLDETIRREPDAKTHRAIIRVRVMHYGEKE